MKILSVHNRYLQRGGEDESREAEEQLLLDHGHEVIRYEEDNRRIAQLGSWQTAARTVWSRESYKKVESLIQRHRPDLMHVQNFFPLISPSVYYAAHRHQVPVVQTLRNYRILCANSLLLRNGSPCEACLNRRVAWPGIRYACYRNSHCASAAIVVMQALHRFRKTWHRQVAMYIALTRFVADKFIEAGFPADRMAVKPNFLIRDPGIGDSERRGAVFVGRLTAEKGVLLLLQAWKQAAITEPLRIIGTGPLLEEVQTHARHHPHVEVLGEQSQEKVFAAIKASRFLVFPSLWYETFGRTIIEAFATGTPVVASRRGAAAELIQEGVNGWLFEPGNLNDLVRMLVECVRDPNSSNQMGIQARSNYLALYTPDRNYALIKTIYEHAISMMVPRENQRTQQF